MLAHCDKAGVCDMHPRAIAEEVGLTVEQVRAALDELEAPDIESRTPDEEGRRIIRLDEHRSWGWRVVNYLVKGERAGLTTWRVVTHVQHMPR